MRIKDLRPYGLALGSLLSVVAVYVLCYFVLAIRFRPLYALIYGFLLIIFLGSAWRGYGPGVLVCAVLTLVVPRLRPAPQPWSMDLTRFGLVFVISLLISRISQTREQREAELRQTALDLDHRVRERTEEAVRAAETVRQTEERLRFVLDSADIGYWDYDPTRRLITRSRKCDDILGDAEPPGGWDLDALLRHVHVDDREAVATLFREARQNGSSSLEFRIVRDDYTVRWVWLQARYEERLSGVLMDITERKQSADSLREQAQLLDLAHDGILSMDWNGTITFWSEGAQRMYGWTREDALGKVSHHLLQTDFPETIEKIRAQLLETGHWEGELGHRRRDGAQLTVASRWAIRRDPLGYLEINTDITERRRMEEQFQHTQKLESLGVLAGGVAHDFNNLLTGILGNASLALEQPDPALIEEVIKAAERAADLTRQLLAYAGKGKFVIRTLDLSRLVREIAGLVQTSIPKSVQIRFDLAEQLPGIDADPGQIQQVIMNLVINGAEAIGPGGGSVLVRTALDRMPDGDFVCLQVNDSGCGMSEEMQAKIFDPFFTTKFAGRGLGLSAVQGIVRAHRGTLSVSSKPGHGTSFRVWFPASPEAVLQRPESAAGDLTGAGTILVVDDDEMVRQTARHALERYRYQVVLAADGTEAVAIYQQQHSQIVAILLDLTMPGPTVEETLAHLQEIQPGVRILLTSGYSEADALHRFADKGLAGFVQKPYTAATLAERVKEVLTPVSLLEARSSRLTSG